MPSPSVGALLASPLFSTVTAYLCVALSVLWLILRVAGVKRRQRVAIAWWAALVVTLGALAWQTLAVPPKVVLAPGAAAAARGRLPQDSWQGTVTHVADGDTLEVSGPPGEVKIRLWGVDAPEKGQASGPEARDCFASLVGGRQVYVWPRDLDRYGRTVALLYTEDGACVNEELLAEGWAWWYREYAPKDTVAQALEAQARRAHRGLWARSSPTPPWEYRKAARSGRQTGSGPASGRGRYGSSGSRTSGSR